MQSTFVDRTIGFMWQSIPILLSMFRTGMVLEVGILDHFIFGIPYVFSCLFFSSFCFWSCPIVKRDTIP